MDAQKLITVTEAAKILELNRGTLIAQIRAGHLKASRIGSMYVMTLEAVAHYANHHKGKGGWKRKKAPPASLSPLPTYKETPEL